MVKITTKKDRFEIHRKRKRAQKADQVNNSTRTLVLHDDMTYISFKKIDKCFLTNDQVIIPLGVLAEKWTNKRYFLT